MQRTLKVFIDAAGQDKLAKKYPILERYEDFALVQVTSDEADRLARKYLVEDITDQYVLNIAGQTINPNAPSAPQPETAQDEEAFSLAAMPGAPGTGPAASVEAALSPGPHHYLVAFAGPIKPEWMQAVTAAGGELRAPYQNFTYIANMDVAALANVTGLPFVNWVGRLPTSARISDDLRNRPSQESFSGAVQPARGMPSTYIVEFFAPQDLQPAKVTIFQLGAQIIGEDEPAGLLVIELTGSDDERMALLEAIAAVHGVRSIHERVIKRLSNDVAPKFMGAAISQNTNGLGLSGEGEIIGVADTGLDSGDPGNIHPDFSGRVLWIKSYPITADYSQYLVNPGGDDGPADVDSGHGTHVAGSALGSGACSLKLPRQSSPIRGLAYQARLVFQAIEQEMNWNSPAFVSKFGRFLLSGIPLDLGQLFGDAYAQGVRIHSNSWGGGAPGEYDPQCEQLDRFVWEHKDFCVLCSAGNDGADHDRDGRIDPISISSPGTAKNNITIGACESKRPAFKQATYGQWWPGDYPALPLRDDPIADNPGQVAAFSSRGPTNDGRIKPDLLAPGTFILSTRSTRIAPDNTAWAEFSPSPMYFFNGGTSMATPLAAGAAALAREFLRKVKKIANPSAALLKAALIAGATRIKSASPRQALADNEQGYGRINLDEILAPAAPAQAIFLDISPGLQTGQSYTLKIDVQSKACPLRIVLAYSDYPGRSLVNNLNLIIRSPTGKLYTGNAQRGKLTLDNKNNVELLEIPAPRPGAWQIQVIGANIPAGPQDFALVVRGDFHPS